MRIPRLTLNLFIMSASAAILVVSLALANQGDIIWQGVGPGGGGAWQGVTVNPVDPSKALMGSDIGGIYRTVDAGATWANANTGSILDPAAPHRYWIVSFAYSNQNPDIVYAGATGGVLKSTDGGASWNLSPGAHLIESGVIAVDPQNDNHVYAASGGIINGGNGCIYVSVDGGATFTPTSFFSGISADCALGADPDKPIARSILIDPSGSPGSRRILVSTSMGLYRQEPNGPWQLIGTGLPHDECGMMAYDPTGNTIYLAMRTQIDPPVDLPDEPYDPYVDPTSWRGGVYKSSDWGTTWVDASGDEDTSIINGGFESGVSPATGWSYLNPNDNGAFTSRLFQPSTDPEDQYVLRISTPDYNQGGVGVKSVKFPVVAGERYVFAASAKAAQQAYKPDDPNDFTSRSAFFGVVRFYNGETPVRASRCYPGEHENLWEAKEKNNDWRRYESVYRAPMAATHAQVELFSANAQGITLVDDVEVRRSDALPRAHAFQLYTHASYQAIAADPLATGEVYVGTIQPNSSDSDGVWKTTTGGATWDHETRNVFKENVTDKRSNVDPLDTYNPADPTGCDPNDPGGYPYSPVYGLGFGSGAGGQKTLYMASSFFVYRKTGSGSGWEGARWDEVTHDKGESSCTVNVPCPTWKGRGAPNNVWAMNVAMKDQRMAYGDNDNLLLVTENAGTTFRQEGLSRGKHLWPSALGIDGSAVTSLVFDLDSGSSSLFAGIWNEDSLDTNGGVISSCNLDQNCPCLDPSGCPNGQSWRRHGNGYPGGGRVHLALMEDDLYAAIESRGVYRIDADSPLANWDTSGIQGDYTLWNPPSERPVVFVPTSIAADEPRGRIFVGLGYDDPEVLGVDPVNNGIWMHDPIASWCKITPTSSSEHPYAEAVVSLRAGADGELYAGTQDLGMDNHLGALYRGTGTGCVWTWERLPLNVPATGPAQAMVTGIVISPLDSSVLYAAASQENGNHTETTRQAGIYKSVDEGQTWERLDLNGLMSLRNPILAIGHHSSSGLTMYAATSGSGIFKATILPPAPPTGLSGIPVGGRDVELQWSDNSHAEQGYRIERKKNAGGQWSQIFQSGPNVTYHLDTTPSGGVFFYRVRAFDEAGNSAYSNEVHVPN